MKLSLSVEGGSTYATIAYDAADVELLDRQCTRLGMAQGTTRQPLATTVEAGVSFWKDTTASRLSQAIRAKLELLLPSYVPNYQYADDINAPLLSAIGPRGRNGLFVNVGLLRLRIQPGTPLRVLVNAGVYSPEEIGHIFRALGEAYKALASLVFEAELTMTVRMPQAPAAPRSP